MAKDSKGLDAIDRKLLGLLSENAEQSYAELGAKVGLSAPAVHERVKRYKASGRIKATVALLEPVMTGRNFLAFVHVLTNGWGKSEFTKTLQEFPEVEEIHSVAGDSDLLIKIRMENNEAMEALLALIYAMPQVVSTRSYIALSTYLERPAQAGVSDFPDPRG